MTWIYIWTSEIKDIFVWEWIDSYDTMRWPCPTGFHIPTQWEWNALRTMMRTWSTNWLIRQSYLKMPKSWKIYYLDWTVSATQWVYTSCTSTGWTQNYDIVITDSGANVNYTYKWNWLTIRPFKDTPVVPDDTRTVEKQWTWNAGVYRDTVNWIISISSDWITWITIADRNLWATNINDKWDYYQRGNNYAFPNTWPVTTSNTQVDASNYWPWNYYSSSTFIYWNQDWSSVQNDDLRWASTWITKKWNVIEVYVGTTLIRSE